MTTKKDIDFVRMMIPHHQKAVNAAADELLYGGDPKIKDLARKIFMGQREEIETMKAWLKENDPGGGGGQMQGM